MFALTSFIACLLPALAARRQGASDVALSPADVVDQDLSRMESTLEEDLESIDSHLSGENKTWANIRQVYQLAPTLDDISHPKMSANLVLTAGGPALAANGTYWVQVNMTGTSAAAAASFVEKINDALEKYSLLSEMEASWEGTTISFDSRVRHLPHGADAALQAFLAHVGHINVTEDVLGDFSSIVQNPDEPIVEELLKGVRYEMDTVLTKAVAQAAVDSLAMKVKNEAVFRHRGICSAILAEVPCLYSWEGPCCSTTSCVYPSNPESYYENYKSDQCLYNATACQDHCEQPGPGLRAYETLGLELSKKFAQMFAGMSGDVRIAYNDDKRRELLRIFPALNFTYNSLVAKGKAMRVPVEMRGLDWLVVVADLLEEATASVDSLDSVEVKNLPGVTAKISMTNVKPFALFGSFLNDTGMLTKLRESPVQEVLQAVEHRLEGVEHRVEDVLESVKSALPEQPSKQIPIKATLAFGPSLDHVNLTNSETLSILPGAANYNGKFTIEVNMSTTSDEAATQLADHLNSLLVQCHVSDYVKISPSGRRITVTGMDLNLPPNETWKSLQTIMKHIGHINTTVAFNNNLDNMMVHPDTPVIEWVKSGMRYTLDATLTDALEKAILDKVNESHNGDMSKMPLAAQLVPLFAGASFDESVAYDPEMIKDLKDVPGLNMTFGDLQAAIHSMYAEQIPDDVRGSPAAVAGVEAIVMMNRTLDRLESIEIKGVPGIQALLTFDDIRPFQFYTQIMDGSGILQTLRVPATTTMSTEMPWARFYRSRTTEAWEPHAVYTTSTAAEATVEAAEEVAETTEEIMTSEAPVETEEEEEEQLAATAPSPPQIVGAKSIHGTNIVADMDDFGPLNEWLHE